MADASIRIQHRPVRRRRGNRHVGKLDVLFRRAVAPLCDGDPPWLARRTFADGGNLADIGQHAGASVRAQHVGDAVGRIALSDTVERQRHAGLRKHNRAAAAGNMLPADKGACRRERRCVGITARLGQQTPHRLDCRVEPPGGEAVDVIAKAEQPHHVRRRIVQPPGTVQPHQCAVGAIEAEQRLHASDLGERGIQRRLVSRLLAARDCNGTSRSQREPLPAQHIGALPGGECRQSGRACDHLDGTPATEHHRTGASVTYPEGGPTDLGLRPGPRLDDHQARPALERGQS